MCCYSFFPHNSCENTVPYSFLFFSSPYLRTNSQKEERTTEHKCERPLYGLLEQTAPNTAIGTSLGNGFTDTNWGRDSASKLDLFLALAEVGQFLPCIGLTVPAPVDLSPSKTAKKCGLMRANNKQTMIMTKQGERGEVQQQYSYG